MHQLSKFTPPKFILFTKTKKKLRHTFKQERKLNKNSGQTYDSVSEEVLWKERKGIHHLYSNDQRLDMYNGIKTSQ